MDDEAHEQEADRLEREAEQLAARSDDVGSEIKDLREDWDSKKKSQQSPGAMDAADAAPGGLGEEEEPDEDEAADSEEDEDEDYESR